MALKVLGHSLALAGSRRQLRVVDGRLPSTLNSQRTSLTRDLGWIVAGVQYSYGRAAADRHAECVSRAPKVWAWRALGMQPLSRSSNLFANMIFSF